MRLLLLMSLLLLAGATSAATRHEVSNMSCAQIDALLSAEGSAILAYRSKRDPSLTLYDLFVSDFRFCRMGEVPKQARIRAAEGSICRVSTCREFTTGFRP